MEFELRTISIFDDFTLYGPFILLIGTLISVSIGSEDYLGDRGHHTFLLEGCFFGLTFYLSMQFLQKYYPTDDAFEDENIVRNIGSQIPANESIKSERQMQHVAVQTENRNFKAESVKLTVQHEKYSRRLQREIRTLRRMFSERMCKFKKVIKQKNAELCSLQLKFPHLFRERATLRAEKDAIDKQLNEEASRNQTLTARFKRLNEQFAHGVLHVPMHQQPTGVATD